MCSSPLLQTHDSIAATVRRKSGWSFMAIMSEASTLPNEVCGTKSEKHRFQGFYTIGCLKIWVSWEHRLTSRVSILTGSRWGADEK